MKNIHSTLAVFILMTLSLSTAAKANTVLSVNGYTGVDSILLLPGETVKIDVKELNSGISENYTIYLDFGPLSEGCYALSNPFLCPAAGDQSFFAGPYDLQDDGYDNQEVYIRLVNPDPCNVLFLIDLFLFCEEVNKNVLVELWDSRKGYDQPADTLRIYQVSSPDDQFIIALPKKIYMFAEEGQSNPYDQTLTIQRFGEGSIAWTIEHDCNWLSVDPCHGNTSDETDLITLSADATELDIGRYNCKLTITDPCTAETLDEIDVLLQVRKDNGILYVPLEYPDIQTAINNAKNTEMVMVADGTYDHRGDGDIDLMGKAITVRSEHGPADCTITGWGIEQQRTFFFQREEGRDTVVQGFTTNGNLNLQEAILCNTNSRPTIANCIFTNCSQGAIIGYGGGSPPGPQLTNCTFRNNNEPNTTGIIISNYLPAHGEEFCPISMSNCILAENTNKEFEFRRCCKCGCGPIHVDYSILKSGWQEKSFVIRSNIIEADPCFADSRCHLKSQTGRWNTETEQWVYDNVSSPAIDAGDPCSTWTDELWPHGGRINAGAYGGTAEASMSPNISIGNVADIDDTVDGIVNLRDFSRFANAWLYEQNLLKEDLDRNGAVNTNDLKELTDNWLWNE